MTILQFRINSLRYQSAIVTDADSGNAGPSGNAIRSNVHDDPLKPGRLK
jgi:hypothetical protein